jgi:ribosome-associated protein
MSPVSGGGVEGDGPGPEVVRVTSSLRIPVSELQFRFSASGGPGGQNANKVATRVELRFDVAGSPSLGPYQRSRLLEKLGPEVRVVADDERSQLRNRQLATERFRERLAAALRVEKSRRPTRPTKGAKERRLADKRRLSERKRARRPDLDD